MSRRSRTPLTPRIARLVRGLRLPAQSSFFCGCVQTLNPLQHPPPLSLLEGAGIAPRRFFFGRGHFLRSRPVPRKHLRRQCINLGARNETRPDDAFPKQPKNRAPDRARCRADANPYQCLLDGIHASAAITWFPDYLKSRYSPCRFSSEETILSRTRGTQPAGGR